MNPTDSEWLIPNWSAPPNIRAVCTTRHSGNSNAPFDNMNLGEHVGDVPAHVSANRALLEQSIHAKPVFLNQVHGMELAELTAHTAHSTVADACITEEENLACTIMVADCLPVLFASGDGQVVAAAHAGWRSLAGQDGHGVLEEVIQAFAAKDKSASETVVWLGPCIGPAAFEVGAEVKAAFEKLHPEAAAMFIPGAPEKYLANLAGLARQRLKQMGITNIYGNDSSAGWCTAGNPELFFSYRRDGGATGRMAACVWKQHGAGKDLDLS